MEVDRTIVESVSRLYESNKMALKCLDELYADLEHGEHVDKHWIKDCIELNSGISIIERSNFNIEIKKLKKVAVAVKEYLEADGSISSEKIYDALDELDK